jgi:hypothetical protein
VELDLGVEVEARERKSGRGQEFKAIGLVRSAVTGSEGFVGWIANILVPEEVLPFFTALAPEQRPVFATAILAGLRKGELCALQ